MSARTDVDGHGPLITPDTAGKQKEYAGVEEKMTINKRKSGLESKN